LKIIKIEIMWKNIVFQFFEDCITWGTFSNHTEYLDFPLGHPSLDYYGLSTLNFSILFAWAIPNLPKFLLILLSYQSS
jgi:hypothetical protein